MSKCSNAKFEFPLDKFLTFDLRSWQWLLIAGCGWFKQKLFTFLLVSCFSCLFYKANSNSIILCLCWYSICSQILSMYDHVQKCDTQENDQKWLCAYLHWKYWLHPHILSGYTFPYLKYMKKETFKKEQVLRLNQDNHFLTLKA